MKPKLKVRVRPAMARRRYHAASRSWRIHTRSTITPVEPVVATLATVQAIQQALPLPAPKLGMRQIAKATRDADRKRRQRKRYLAHRRNMLRTAKGLQYSIKLSGWSDERKLAFRSKCRPETAGNEEQWSDGLNGLRRVHVAVLLEALYTLKDHLEVGSPNAGDVIAWVEYEGEDVPFAFDTCVKVAAEASIDKEFREFANDWDIDVDFSGADPADLRMQLLEMVRRHPAYRIDYRTLLKCGILDADAGDPDALHWIFSDARGEGTFLAAVASLGFDNPDRLREELGFSKPQPLDRELLFNDLAIPA